MTVESAPLAQAVAEERPPDHFEFSRLIRALGYVLVLLALASAGMTFVVLMGLTPVAPPWALAVSGTISAFLVQLSGGVIAESPVDIVFFATVVNGALVGCLVLVVAWELIGLLRARWRGRAGANLHVRIVALFSFVGLTAVLAIMLAITASVGLIRGIDDWFSTRTRTLVDNSLSIARAYAGQQAGQLSVDLRAVKSELQRAPGLISDDPDRFTALLNSLAEERNLFAVFLVDSSGELVALPEGVNIRSVPLPQPDDLARAANRPADILILPPGSTNAVAGITELVGYDGLFLYAVRPLDPRINRYLNMTEASVSEYPALEATRAGIQNVFSILFLVITVVVLLSAIWLGIGFANRLVAPIRRLIDAAKEVSRGNLAVSVKPRRSDGDLGDLGATFNTMTEQLRSQREALLSASEQIDSRRRFTEAVLSGAPAGIVGIDAESRVTIVNRAGLQILGVSEDDAVGKLIGDTLPKLGPVVEVAMRDGRLEHRDQIIVPRGGRERTINVRVTTERAAGYAHGYVVTLDDITDLVSAQRSSAWADVARRIAHEMKNPLTPIQLSAERLKRKFSATIHEDAEVFQQCTDTIIRQVGDIGRMVDEFSSFARMPKPTMTVGNLSDTIREAAFVIGVANPEVAFDLELPDEPLLSRFDARLMGQALTNVFKNAAEAIAAVPAEERGKGRVAASAEADNGSVIVTVTDNGIGFPKENRQRLLEPYMTTREKGTGLGLAIVTKIIEEHGGRLELLDAPAVATGGRGARIRITLLRVQTSAETKLETAEPETVPAE